MTSEKKKGDVEKMKRAIKLINQENSLKINSKTLLNKKKI